jgi:Putative polyhydroxyalkanoic acid system protein (PHA_gran_rgn)
MKITVEHGKTKAETIAAVDRTFDQMFQGMGGGALQIVVDQRSWQGDVMNFALTAKMGFFSTPIKGTVTVTDRDVTVDVDLGVLNQFVSEKAAGEMIGGRIRGLLK